MMTIDEEIQQMRRDAVRESRKDEYNRKGYIGRRDGYIGLSEKEAQGFSFVKAIRSLMSDDWRGAEFEREVSEAASQESGRTARGCMIPLDVLSVRDLSAGTATDGAEVVGTDLLAGSFIDVLRNQMVLARAGATFIPGLVGDVQIPRKTAGSTATWISSEDGDATQSDPQFDQVTLAPKDLATYTQFTRRLMLQSSPQIEGIVRADLARAIAQAIDLAGLYGSGASGQPTGIVETTGINTFDLAGAAPTYAESIRMIKEVMNDNALNGRLSYIIDPDGWEDAKTTEKVSGTAEFIVERGSMINSYPVQVSNQVTSEDWFFGNWADLLIGMWSGVDILVDKTTHSLKGKTRVVAFQTVDVAVRHPESFCYCNDAVVP